MPKNLTQKQIMMLGFGVVVVLILGVVLILNIRHKANNGAQVNLTVWGTSDQHAMNDLITAYGGGAGASSNGPQITYTQIDPAQYNEKLLSALAAGQGPDVFEIGNHAMPRWRSVLAPIPAAATYNLVNLQNDFPTTVYQDFVYNDQIYALPFSIDTLAMIYNKDLFDSAGIAVPPKTWDDFQNDVGTLRSINAQGQLNQAAAAIGGSGSSIADAPDILFLLMLQNGTKMTDDSFSSAMFASGGGGNSGLSAFNYYLQFANAASPYYTWNDSMGDSLASFIQGKTAIIFDYQSAIKTIKAKAPFLNVGVAPMPQPTGATVSINYPRYTGFAVSRWGQSAAAWDFVLKLTTNVNNENIYTKDTGAPPALRAAIQEKMSDPALAVFAAQALTARSWYEADDAKIADIFNTAIQSVQNGAANPAAALNAAQSAVDQVMTKK